MDYLPVELTQLATSTQKKETEEEKIPHEKYVTIKTSDMSHEMKKEAIKITAAAMKKGTVEKALASRLKQEFDKKFKPTWQCIVGKNFYSSVTHESGSFIYFYYMDTAILLFKGY